MGVSGQDRRCCTLLRLGCDRSFRDNEDWALDVSACQCYGHTDQCYYDEEVAKNMTSIDISGQYEGGGVCVGCQHNTMGINCEMCRPGYFRPQGVALDSIDVCQGQYNTHQCISHTEDSVISHNREALFISQHKQKRLFLEHLDRPWSKMKFISLIHSLLSRNT